MKSLDRRIKRELSKQTIYNLGFRTPTDISIGHEIFQSGYFVKKILKTAFLEISDTSLTTVYYFNSYEQALFELEKIGNEIKSKEELFKSLEKNKLSKTFVQN